MKKVLVIDDEENLTFLIKSYLEFSSDYFVKTANNGKDGLKAVRHFKPDLILLDITMPGMDGLTVLKKLKESVKTMDIPVIMLTALSDHETKMNATALYNEDYIVKPAEMEHIKGRIEEIFVRSGL